MILLTQWALIFRSIHKCCKCAPTVQCMVKIDQGGVLPCFSLLCYISDQKRIALSWVSKCNFKHTQNPSDLCSIHEEKFITELRLMT